MKVVVTAGNTQAPIDRVRCLTNIFTGRTGAAIAECARRRGHSVVLLTSQPQTIVDGAVADVRPYRTFAELEALMQAAIAGRPDALVHSAAVSDYLVGGIYAPAAGTQFDPADGRWHGAPPVLVDRGAAKVKSDEPELWLRLVRAPKLVDRVRPEWGFRGLLVKFKLQVGMSDAELLAIAERSRQQSSADLMVANTLEGANEYAFIGADAAYERVSRPELPDRLLDALERLKERRDG